MNTEWKLVPVEPTDEMEVAAENDYEQTGATFPRWKSAYAAMLNAAPPAPTSHPIPTGATGEDERAPMPNPSLADLDDPVFEAIWQTIKAWDVNVPAYYVGYCGANGSHAKLILDAVRAAPNSSGGDALSETVTILPDGSAFAVASFPLPTGHWLYAEREYEPGAEEPKELPAPILTHEQREAVVAAIRYAVRGATMCGKEPDFDPDALVQNAVYALCGPYTAAISQQSQRKEA